ncbi:MAG: hypothetical protein AB1497_11160 [Bacillota bacterium]
MKRFAPRFKRWHIACISMAMLILVIRLLLNLGFASAPPSKTWGRHITLGISQSAYSMALSADDKGLFVVWPKDAGLEYAVADTGGRLINTGSLPIATNKPLGMKASRSSEGTHLLWIDQLSNALFWTLLDSNGEILNGPAPLDAGVWSFSLTGNVLVYAKEDMLYAFELSAQGPKDRGIPLKLPQLRSYDARLDASGNLHVVAVTIPEPRRPRLRYLHMDARGIWQKEVDLYSQYVPSTSSLGPVSLGIDTAMAYVFWNVESVTGGDIGGSRSFTEVDSLLFPLSNPSDVVVRKLRLRTSPLTEYASYVADASPRDGQQEYLDVAVSALVQDSMRKKSVEVVSLRFRQGELISSDRVSRTRNASMKPVGTESDGARFIAWYDVEGRGTYAVRLSSDNEVFRKHSAGLKSEYALTALINTFQDMIAAATLIFVALFWLTPAYFVIMAVTVFAIGYTERRPWTVFLLGAALSVAFKTGYLTRALYKPGLIQIMPAWMSSVYTGILFCLLFSAVGGGIVYLYTKETHHRAAIPLFSVFALTDSAFTLLFFAGYMFI